MIWFMELCGNVGVLGIVVLWNHSPACTGKYKQSILYGTQRLTCTTCECMKVGQWLQGDSDSFHIGHGKGGVDSNIYMYAL